MDPLFTFFAGLFTLALFAWYFVTTREGRKRWLGLILTFLLVSYCVELATPASKKIRLGLDLRGGTSFLLRLIPQPGQQITTDMLQQAVEVIRKRVDQFGVGEPVIAPQGTERILVQIPGLDPAQIEATRETLKQVAKLEFAKVYPGNEALIAQIERGEALLPPGYEIKSYVTPKVEKGEVIDEKMIPRLIVKQKPDLAGEHVTKAFVFFDQGGYGVSLELDKEGADAFYNVTSELAPTRGRLAILLDGKIQSAPSINSGSGIAGGHAQITGHFKEKEARELASALENPLRTPVEIEETRSVSPTLGGDAIRAGVLSGLGGLALVMLFVLCYYRLAGVVALFGLGINIILLFGMMTLFHFVLTLPGIAGIILTIGLAVDSNVLLYERLREELAGGKSLGPALDGAYSKAFSAIFDANVTTLITAGILFWQATGPVKGFSISLVLGVIASMFSAILFTRTAFRWMMVKGGLKRLTMANLAPKKQFQFLKHRVIAVGLSLAVLVGSMAIFAKRGANNFGIDFRGGDLLVLDVKPTMKIAEARQALLPLGLGDNITLQHEQAGEKQLLSIRSPEDTSFKILNTLRTSFPDRTIVPEQQEKVGGQIGLEFARKALLALGLGMLGILLYVSMRFGLSFAIGALVALLHDVIITVGLFSLLGGELSLVMVGAILTIAGYSINDTIVVYDRIREGLHHRDSGSIETLMNRSINETLGRTMLTGGLTFLSVSALFLFGGAVLKDFAFAILIGILVGTYSSVFVASPIVLWWSKWSGKKLR
ncbi:MAG: protein translocase subunit SecD [Chthoniobacterales bacterium]|nr:protein translocase subunit SecD [Chthoniobacterales bacterium]